MIYEEMDVLIFWDEAAPAGFQRPLVRALSALLPMPVRFCESPLLLNGFIGSRRQTDASVLLDSLDLHKRRTRLKDLLLLIVSADLCRRNDEFLFGLARPDTGTAVVSSARFGNEYYGLPREDDALIDRLAKESAHETGHLLGLDHCRNRECIMYNPLTLEDLDRKRRGFCPACKKLLDAATGI
jgi:archaemetzincin